MLTVLLCVALGVTGLIVLIVGIASGVSGKKKATLTYRRMYMRPWCSALIAIGAVFLGLSCLVAPLVLGCQYSDSLYMPQELAALNATIEQQSEYITTGDVAIGAGLEGLEIKREIQQTIRERNMLIAQIEYRQISPWYYFKPELPE